MNRADTEYRKDIIRMGRQAGAMIEAAQEKDLLWLEAFAALVSSAAQAKEREACAKVCDDLWEDDGTAYDCAEAIRTLGQA